MDQSVFMSIELGQLDGTEVDVPDAVRNPAQADHTRERQPQTCLGMFLVMIVVNCIRSS